MGYNVSSVVMLKVCLPGQGHIQDGFQGGCTIFIRGFTIAYKYQLNKNIFECKMNNNFSGVVYPLDLSLEVCLRHLLSGSTSYLPRKDFIV